MYSIYGHVFLILPRSEIFGLPTKKAKSNNAVLISLPLKYVLITPYGWTKLLLLDCYRVIGPIYEPKTLSMQCHFNSKLY